MAINTFNKTKKTSSINATKTNKNTKEAKAVCRQIGEILKFAKISELSPEDHDEMIGFVSQLTHCIAMSLMRLACRFLMEFLALLSLI